MPQHATLRGTLAPGDHARLNVASRAEANPRSGTCSFTSVNLEPPSQARFTTTDVPVHLYVQDSFPRKGTFVDPAGKHDGGSRSTWRRAARRSERPAPVSVHDPKRRCRREQPASGGLSCGAMRGRRDGGRGQQRGRCQPEQARMAGGGDEGQYVSVLLPERGVHGQHGCEEHTNTPGAHGSATLARP